MRVLRLILLGLIVYIGCMVFLFPAAPVVERIQPQVQPITLAGVTGKLYSGKVAKVSYADDLLPLSFNDVTWKLAPETLIKGGTGVKVSFKGYGGGGQGLVSRQFNGDLKVSDFTFDALPKEMEVLLPFPIASFTGKLEGNISSMVLVNQFFNEMDGVIKWNDASISTPALGQPLTANLGQVDLRVARESENTHKALLTSAGGDIALDGEVIVALNGDYQADILVTPTSNAPATLVNALQRFGRPDPQGGFRVKQSGNVNQLN